MEEKKVFGSSGSFGKTVSRESAPQVVKRIKKGVRPSYLQRNPEAIIDYKRVDVLIKFMTDKGKILPRKVTNLTAMEQRRAAKAIKKARMIGILPFCAK